MNEPKASPVSSPAGACAPHREIPVPRGGLDTGQPRPLIPAPLLRQDPVPEMLLHRGLLSPRPPAASPALPMGGRPCWAQPPPCTCRPRPVSPGAAGAAERARGRGRLCGRKMVFSQPCLIPAASTAPLSVLLRRESRADAVRPGSGDGGGQGCISCSPSWGSCSLSTGLLSSTLQSTCMEGNMRHQAGDVMPGGCWQGMGRVAEGTRMSG